MVRPKKERRIEQVPKSKFYKPAGIPNNELENVSLTLEEIEAVRLKDLEGLNQQQAAEKMEVSRPTFQRILSDARQKIAEALISGKSLKFEGGNYRLEPRCHKCGQDITDFRGGRRHRGKFTCDDC